MFLYSFITMGAAIPSASASNAVQSALFWVTVSAASEAYRFG